MRRIETRDAIERKKKRNTAIVSVFMLVVLLLGTVGFAFSFNDGPGDSGSGSSSSGGSVGGVNYDNARGLWYLDVGGQVIYFSNSPAEVADVEIDSLKMLGDFSGRSLYISSDNQGALNEIGSTLGLYASRVQEACYGECGENLPEMNCTSGNNLIVFGESENSVVYDNEDCVFIEGDLETVDAFLYRILGIA